MLSQNQAQLEVHLVKEDVATSLQRAAEASFMSFEAEEVGRTFTHACKKIWCRMEH